MSIPGSATPLLLATTAAAGPAAALQIDRSLRFNSADSAYLNKTFVSAGNRRTWTWSGWIKKSEIISSGDRGIFTSDSSAGNEYNGIAFTSVNLLMLRFNDVGSIQVRSTAAYRDPGAWMHVVAVADTSNFTASERLELYVNGVLIDDFNSVNYPSQNTEGSINSAVSHAIGRREEDQQFYFNGYLADVHFIDGQALAPTDFGETDENGNWNPKAYTGVFGPRYSGETWSSAAADSYGFDGSTAYNSSATRLYGTSTYHKIVDATTAFTGVTSVVVGTSENVGNIKLDGTVYTTSYTSGVGLTVTSPPSSFSDIEVLGASNGVQIAYVRVNGELLIDSGVNANNSFKLNFSDNSSNRALGYDQSVATTSPNPDGGMDVVTYTGNGTTQTISGFGFQPDFVWIKNRGATGNHTMWDVVRGVNKRLITDANDAESTRTGGLTAFTSDGFVHGDDGTGNTNNNTYLAWGWKAGGAPSLNEDGSLDSQVSVSTDYGFSIVTYTGNGSTGTVGHGLSSTPKWIIVKNRSAAASWFVYHVGTTSGKGLNLNNTEAEFTPGEAGITAVSDSTFSLGSQRGETNANNQNYVAYCWSEVSGFSKFGSYTGNGSLSGPVVTTGFKPRWVLHKRIDAAANWVLTDTQRGINQFVYANSSQAELTAVRMVIKEDGFQITSTSSTTNANNGTYIYAAFADRPGNNFDVNNLVASTHADGATGFDVVTYSGNGGTQVIGGPVYSDFGSGTVSGTKTYDKAFDGSTSTFCEPNDNTTVSFDFTGLSGGGVPVSSSLRIYLNKAGTPAAGHFTVNGTNLGGSVPSGGWLTVSNVSLLQTITLFHQSGASSVELYAVEVDGTVLIDGAGAPLKFQPDLVWIKSRSSGTEGHYIANSINGLTKNVRSNSTSAEQTNTNGVTAADASSFTLGDSGRVNGTSQNYVAWVWNAGANSNKTYTVKVVSDSGNKYRFDDFGTSAVTLDLQEGSTYVFDQSDSSNAGHPIRFGTSANGTDYTTGVTHTGTPGSAGAKTTLVLGTGVSTLYYSCLNHSGMGGQINTNSTAGASNFDGSIQAVVKANNTYGFSIINHTGTGAAGTFGHGLSSAPDFLIFKNREATDNWFVWTRALNSTNTGGVLNSTNAFFTNGVQELNQTLPTDSVIHVANNLASNGNNQEVICYAWSEVRGFSKFGSYTGNGSSTGPTITTGFKPAFLLIKRTDSTGAWKVLDTARDSANPIRVNLDWNTSGTDFDNSENDVDFLSDGFQLKTSHSARNSSGGTYIYMAFADTPDGSVIDSLIDTPTNYDASSGNNGGNYATLNPLSKGSAITLVNGNLEISAASSGSQRVWGTIGVSTGKWYFEFTQSSGSYAQGVGIKHSTAQDNSNNYFYTGHTGQKVNASGSASSYGETWGNDDVIGVAFDLDAGTITFYKNGASQGQAFSGITDATYFPYVSGWSGGSWAGFVNFGARPFKYTPPTDHKSLCTQNLPDPTIADGSTAFDAKLYTGNGSTQSITGLGFSPDWVWTAVRDSTGYIKYLWDTVRGSTKALASSHVQGDDAESTVSNGLTSFDSSGFSLGSNGQVNENNRSLVAWCWDAGTLTDTSNTAGSITPTGVRANASAGFSIITYTGSANGTVGHGLNAAPEFIIAKSRTAVKNWVCYHKALGKDKYLLLNSTNSAQTSSGVWGSAEPTNSVFGLENSSTGGNTDGNLVAYCFAPVEGYSAFGSYTGNGSSDGPFVYTGFRPAFLIVKSTTSGSGNWLIADSTRSPENVADEILRGNTNAAETDSDYFDFLSNGFKLRGTPAGLNSSGETVIYAAFAEHPFKTARAR